MRQIIPNFLITPLLTIYILFAVFLPFFRVRTKTFIGFKLHLTGTVRACGASPGFAIRSRPELQGRCCVPWTCCWLQLGSQCRVSLWQTLLTLSLVPGDRGRGHDHNCVPGPFPAQHLWASTPGDLPPFHPTAPAWKCPHPGHSHQPDQHPFPGKESFRGRKLWLAPPSLPTSSCSCYSLSIQVEIIRWRFSLSGVPLLGRWHYVTPPHTPNFLDLSMLILSSVELATCTSEETRFWEREDLGAGKARDLEDQGQR